LFYSAGFVNNISRSIMDRSISRYAYASSDLDLDIVLLPYEDWKRQESNPFANPNQNQIKLVYKFENKMIERKI
jgi:hypothetical protein